MFGLQILPAQGLPIRAEVGKFGGFPLQASGAADKGGRKELESLCRYVSRRPAV